MNKSTTKYSLFYNEQTKRDSTYYLLVEEAVFLLAVVVAVAEEEEQDCTIGFSILATKWGVMGSTLV